jgi:hypothetical protein
VTQTKPPTCTQAYCLTEPANFFGIDVSDAQEELQPLRALANS